MFFNPMAMTKTVAERAEEEFKIDEAEALANEPVIIEADKEVDEFDENLDEATIDNKNTTTDDAVNKTEAETEAKAKTEVETEPGEIRYFCNICFKAPGINQSPLKSPCCWGLYKHQGLLAMKNVINYYDENSTHESNISIDDHIAQLKAASVNYPAPWGSGTDDNTNKIDCNIKWNSEKEDACLHESTYPKSGLSVSLILSPPELIMICISVILVSFVIDS